MRIAKNIHLSEGAVKALSIQAIENGTNFKNFVEAKLEGLARNSDSSEIAAREYAENCLREKAREFAESCLKGKVREYAETCLKLNASKYAESIKKGGDND